MIPALNKLVDHLLAADKPLGCGTPSHRLSVPVRHPAPDDVCKLPARGTGNPAAQEAAAATLDDLQAAINGNGGAV